MDVDVAIIGGGPAGATVGTLLKKYRPEMTVAILERETFPRDHVGESLLPPLSRILNEMGCWDKIESANFPIKIGATYRWGKKPELWDFEFFPPEHFQDEARPAKYEGQRQKTAFQVDRAIYDHILLDHAAEMGCEVRQNTRVSRIHREADQIAGLEVDGGEVIHARHYVDASGASGILRRALDIPCDYASTLRNIAIWDYWQNAEWAVNIGVGGTRIQVLSVSFGWLWFIPLGPTRTSIGLVTPADYYKECGKSPKELYDQAIRDEPIIASLTRNATCEDKLQTTRDWSFLAERVVGDNWFLVGDSAGFADPILSAGLTMAQHGAQQAAYTILELDRGSHDPVWLREQYARRQAQRIRTHIRFGDYWYTANEQFGQLQEFTKKLAADMGLELTPQGAWAWLAQGGFIDEDLGGGTGGFSLESVKAFSDKLANTESESPFTQFNVFKLDLSGASWHDRAVYSAGKIQKSPCFRRGDKVLPLDERYEVIVQFLQRTSDIHLLVKNLRAGLERDHADEEVRKRILCNALITIELLVADGWVQCSRNPEKPLIGVSYFDEAVRWNKDDYSRHFAELPKN